MPTSTSAALGIAIVSLFSGCAVDSAHIQITERPSTLETRHYQETFDEAYYDLSSAGGLRLVLRKRQPASAEGSALTQTIVVESVWRPVPGVTIAHDTQINAVVTYGLSGQRIIQSLVGAGSVFYYENDAHDRLTGTLAYVTLESKNPADDQGFLQRIELSGDFSARRDSCQALRLANETKRLQRSLVAQGSSRSK